MQVKSQTQLCPNPKCGSDVPLSANNCPKCGTPQRQLLGRGTILQGRYRIDGIRGCGGFGAVYRASDLQTGEPVAIKENHQHRTFSRFEREAKLLMGLSHPNLPKVRDVFTDAETGRAYMVMDFIDGETLQELVERKGSLKWQEAEPIFAQVVTALSYLHRQKIVHRDVKPSNIIVAQQREITRQEATIQEEEVIIPPPQLMEATIRRKVNHRRFDEGHRFWQQSRLKGLQRNGWRLSGVWWSRGKSYSVSVELSADQSGDAIIEDWNCECLDARGLLLCKHAVALLLAWLYEPDTFHTVAEKKRCRPAKRQMPQQVEHQHVVLVDFGIAKVLEAVDPNRPRSSSIVAWTDGYSPPEQYQSGVEVDARADQYALAATMVFTLTGQIPDDTFTRMEKFRNGELTLPPKPEDVPDTVWQAIEVAMGFQPEQRFEGVEEFWKAIGGQVSFKPKLQQANVGDKQTFNLTDALSLVIGGITYGAIVGALLGSISPRWLGDEVVKEEIGIALSATFLALLGCLVGLTAKDESYGCLVRAFSGCLTGALLGVLLGCLIGWGFTTLLNSLELKLSGPLGGTIFGAAFMLIVSTIISLLVLAFKANERS